MVIYQVHPSAMLVCWIAYLSWYTPWVVSGDRCFGTLPRCTVEIVPAFCVHSFWVCYLHFLIMGTLLIKHILEKTLNQTTIAISRTFYMCQNSCATWGPFSTAFCGRFWGDWSPISSPRVSLGRFVRTGCVGRSVVFVVVIPSMYGIIFTIFTYT